MKLLDACEPLFNYICCLNRAARAGAPAYEMSQVRADLAGLFRRIAATVDEHGLDGSYAQVRKALLFFVDDFVTRSSFPWASGWSCLAHEEAEFAGDDKFFHPMLDDTLADPSPEATQRLEIFFTCLGLGFGGAYQNQPDQLRAYMLNIAARLRDDADTDGPTRLCPESYRYTDRTVLFEPTSQSLGLMTAASLGLLVSVLLVSGLIYKMQTHEVASQLDTFLSPSTTTAGTAVRAPGTEAAAHAVLPLQDRP